MTSDELCEIASPKTYADESWQHALFTAMRREAPVQLQFVSGLKTLPIRYLLR